MPDEDAPRTSRRSAKADQAADDELAAELSRAAREAVRQPPDPRLEASFAKLGLWSDPNAPADTGAGEGEAPPRARVADPAPPATSAADGHEDLRAALLEVRLASEGLRRRLDLALRLEAVVIVLVAIVALLVLVRPGS
ncbi:MAG TPA: hypothetical protein VFR14_00835 [Candidatus Limnocylindrales bacterium]|nr:hypothetical protein [Candidatus Limnocylindrales bacterium]